MWLIRLRNNLNLTHLIPNVKKNCDFKMSGKQALLLSSSNCHGYSMLEFAKDEICTLLDK